MPQVKALKSFSGRYGMIRAGERFQCEDGYAKALLRNGLIVIEGAAAEPGPERNRNIPTAPGKAGKEQPGGQGNQPAPTSPPTPAGGKVLTSSSLQADLASRKKTVIGSASGGRKGTPTPRKPKAKGAAAS